MPTTMSTPLIPSHSMLKFQKLEWVNGRVPSSPVVTTSCTLVPQTKVVNTPFYQPWTCLLVCMTYALEPWMLEAKPQGGQWLRSVRLDECTTIDCSKSGKPCSMRHLDQGRHDGHHFGPNPLSGLTITSNDAAFVGWHPTTTEVEVLFAWSPTKDVLSDNKALKFSWTMVVITHHRDSFLTAHCNSTSSRTDNHDGKPCQRKSSMKATWVRSVCSRSCPIPMTKASRSCIRFVLGDHRNIQQRCL